MSKRIFSLETEYALMQEGPTRAASAAEVYDRMELTLRQRHHTVGCDTVGPRAGSHRFSGLIELKEGLFLDTGARVYYDTGHVEWACPECRSALDATIWDLAANRELDEAARLVGPNCGVLVIKNNLDYTNQETYGCHENYSLLRQLPDGRDTVRCLPEALTAFLVTRSIFCGAGRFGASPGSADDPVAFQISQRADFIEHELSKDTRDGRAILNERDEPLADPDIYRRLHLILGDSNLSPWSNLIKLGTTGLVLDALEQGLLKNPPILQSPVRTLRELSRDLECKKSFPLRNGTRSTAFEIQRWYWKTADAVVQRNHVNDLGANLLMLWSKALEDLMVDPLRLSDRADWAMKYRYFEREILGRLKTSWTEIRDWDWIVARTSLSPLPKGSVNVQAWMAGILSKVDFATVQELVNRGPLDWRDYPRQREIYFALRAIDVRFHSLRTRQSFHQDSACNSFDGLTDDAIQSARKNAPRDTRAWLRSRIVRSPRRQKLASLDWDQVNLTDGRSISLLDPFAHDDPRITQVFSMPLE